MTIKVTTKEGLPLGLGVRVTAVLRGEQYKVAIRGWFENQYIIVDSPNFHGESIRVAPQTGCSISYTLDGNFVNFKTAVVHTFYQAISLMILEYPRQFETYNLRRHQRQKAHFPLEFSRSREANPKMQGAIRDISLKGALVTHSELLEKGDHIFLSFKLQTGELTDVRAEVRNIRVNRQNEYEQFVSGLLFVSPPDEHIQILRGFVESRVTDRRNDKRA